MQLSPAVTSHTWPLCRQGPARVNTRYPGGYSFRRARPLRPIDQAPPADSRQRLHRSSRGPPPPGSAVPGGRARAVRSRPACRGSPPPRSPAASGPLSRDELFGEFGGGRRSLDPGDPRSTTVSGHSRSLRRAASSTTGPDAARGDHALGLRAGRRCGATSPPVRWAATRSWGRGAAPAARARSRPGGRGPHTADRPTGRPSVGACRAAADRGAAPSRRQQRLQTLEVPRQTLPVPFPSCLVQTSHAESPESKLFLDPAMGRFGPLLALRVPLLTRGCG